MSRVRVEQWKAYRKQDWPRYLRDQSGENAEGRKRRAEFEEYRAMAADRQAKALLLATWILAAATVGLLLATAVLAYITATHSGSSSGALDRVNIYRSTEGKFYGLDIAVGELPP
jgi:hypothetical protein